MSQPYQKRKDDLPWNFAGKVLLAVAAVAVLAFFFFAAAERLLLGAWPWASVVTP